MHVKITYMFKVYVLVSFVMGPHLWTYHLSIKTMHTSIFSQMSWYIPHQAPVSSPSYPQPNPAPPISGLVCYSSSCSLKFHVNGIT